MHEISVSFVTPRAKAETEARGLARGYSRMRFSECIIIKKNIENKTEVKKKSSNRVIMSGCKFIVASETAPALLRFRIQFLFIFIDWFMMSSFYS